MSLIKSFLTISSLTLISRIFGFVRDILIASAMGAGPMAEVFLVAFKLPNFFRRLFAEGAFNAAFVPMFSSILTEKGKAEAINFASRIFAVLLASLLVFTVIMELSMPFVMYGLAPGFSGEKFNLAVSLTRITFPYLLFISLVSLLAGILNSFGKFAAVAASPIILNICLIVAILFASEYTETSAHALSYAVAIAGFLQFIWLVIACRKAGIHIRITTPKINSDVKRFLKKMAPGIIGAGVVQINLWVDVIIATFIPSAIAYLYYADRINQLPLAIIGTAMGVALLPKLSKQISGGKKDESIYSQNRALELVLLLTIPATAAFMVISQPIITVLFQRGAFSANESMATSYALMAYAIGLPAFVMAKIFTTSFFAHSDTKTPVKIAIICLVCNVVLNIAFVFMFIEIGVMPHIGLALATSLSSWLNVILLVLILMKSDNFHFDDRIKNRFPRIVFASIVMAVVLFVTDWFISGKTSIYALIILIIAGKLSFFITGVMCKAFDIKEIKSFMKRR